MVIEERNTLSDKTQDMSRAIDSLREEMNAIDFYNQRADACKDKELKQVLLHNAKEEKEHAAMLIEWIRRNDEEFDHEVNDWVNSDKSLSH